jgi:hypothetical protein
LTVALAVVLSILDLLVVVLVLAAVVEEAVAAGREADGAPKYPP